MSRSSPSQGSGVGIFLAVFGVVVLAVILIKFWLIIVILLSIAAITALAIYFGKRHASHSAYPANDAEFSQESVPPVKESSPLPGPGREPLPLWRRNKVYDRANQKCENPFCQEDLTLEIHHINMNRDDNKLNNLIALCHRCHEDAHSGKYPAVQVYNWMATDYHRLQQKEATCRQPN
jgi:hypothetical protein